MSKKDLNLVDFLYLQESIYDMERALKPYPRHDAVFPLFSGETVREEQMVELGDVLTASLNAVDNATRGLREKGIALGKDPIEINLTGSLVGISPDAGRIIVRIQPKG
jgi:hypothetical protein